VIDMEGRQSIDRAPASHGDMILVQSGPFRMGSDRHYPEEAPAHCVTVGGFWMDRTPVTNQQFREFVEATGYVTVAEIAPDPKDYPGALPHMLKAGSLAFAPPNGRWICAIGATGGPLSSAPTGDDHMVRAVQIVGLTIIGGARRGDDNAALAITCRRG